MRKASTLIGLTIMALATVAQAQESAPVSPASPPPATAVSAAPASTPAPQSTVVAAAPVVESPVPRRLELGVSVLAMGLPSMTSDNGIMQSTTDGSLAYGASVALGYRVFAGLSVGIAPQVIFGVNAKGSDAGAATEYNFMGRVAYTLPLFDSLAFYAEALPGYSMKSGSRWSRGFVLAVGGGVAMGLTDRTFANIGVGYQFGFQNLYLGAGAVHPDREDFVRVALGGGVRF